MLGGSRYRYDPDHYLIATLEMPRVSQVLEAAPDHPYLSLILELSPALVSSILEEAGQVSTPGSVDVRAMDVSLLDENLQDAVVRLLRLIDAPAEAPVLMPIIKREIVYRLLTGQQGARLRHLAVKGSYTPHITRAVGRIREDFNQPCTLRTDLRVPIGRSGDAECVGVGDRFAQGVTKSIVIDASRSEQKFHDTSPSLFHESRKATPVCTIMIYADTNSPL